VGSRRARSADVQTKGGRASGEVRFGIAVSAAARPDSDPVGSARQAEQLGFDLISVSDHLHGSFPTFETWTLLTWLASSTERIRLAPLVLGLPYRPPAVVAKMAESLDRLSDGRLILGMGGGGSDDEFRGFGLAVRRPAEKVEALAEAVDIVRGLWQETPFTYHGRHFQVQEAEVEPKPAHRIPIWLGTYGRKSLALTGRVADGWNPSFPYAPPEIAGEMRDRVRRAAEEAGRDPDSIECAYNVSVWVDERGQPNPRLVTGGTERVAEQLVEFVRMGFGTLIFWARGGAEQRERLASEVLPLVRQAL
jgi:alkanesulfonate monooxygenase SsuD/methylene tetrahydromethanopterin reductase-like flavin-dependent oxidoreductase (luciferase family)